jgi:hypothetical protein
VRFKATKTPLGPPSTGTAPVACGGGGGFEQCSRKPTVAIERQDDIPA